MVDVICEYGVVGFSEEPTIGALLSSLGVRNLVTPIAALHLSVGTLTVHTAGNNARQDVDDSGTEPSPSSGIFYALLLVQPEHGLHAVNA